MAAESEKAPHRAEIKDLIEQINQEGIAAANLRAQEIEADARRRAEEIITQAEREADSLLKAARAEIAKDEEKTRTLLVQAGRDLLLSLKKEMNTILERVILSDVQQSLSAEVLAIIIKEIISVQNTQEEVVVFLKEEDRALVEREFLAKLKEETKRGIVLKTQSDLRAGFCISFDAGKSYYDFSDKALAEYLGKYVKPKLNALLNG